MDFDYKDFFKRLYQKIFDDDILGNAAQVAFYFTFALFPLLLFLMTLLGLILSDRQDMRQELFTLLGQVMPASAFELMRETLIEVTSNATGGKLTIGILITLWSASTGIDNVRATLNEVYNLTETRSWFRSKATSLILTICFGVFILSALAFVVYGSQILAWIIPVDAPVFLEVLEWLVILCLLALAFQLIYNFAPNHDPFRWKWITWGAVTAIVLWLLLSGAFQLYLSYFNTYAATYGSLGALIILLLWLYLTALVLLIGGAVNAIFDEKSGVKEEAKDPEKAADEKSESGKEAKT